MKGLGVRSGVARKWEQFYSRGGRIGGYPISEHIERHLLDNGLGGGPVLEIGCGTGRTFSHIMEVLSLPPYSRPVYVGVDASMSALKAASGREGLWPVLCDMFTQPFASESFGLIYARNVLEGYTDNAAANFGREVYRLLMKGGLLLVEERGPTDRELETWNPTAAGRRDRGEGERHLAAIFRQLSAISFSEHVSKRRAEGKTVITDAIAAVFRKAQ